MDQPGRPPGGPITDAALDPTTLAVTAKVATPPAPDGLATDGKGRISVVAQQGPTLATIDPASATMSMTGVLGTLPQLYDQANLDIVVTQEAVWVSSFAANGSTGSPVARGPLAFQAPVLADPGGDEAVESTTT